MSKITHKVLGKLHFEQIDTEDGKEEGLFFTDYSLIVNANIELKACITDGLEDGSTCLIEISSNDGIDIIATFIKDEFKLKKLIEALSD
jgi:hypothetical protein